MNAKLRVACGYLDEHILSIYNELYDKVTEYYCDELQSLGIRNAQIYYASKNNPQYMYKRGIHYKSHIWTPQTLFREQPSYVDAYACTPMAKDTTLIAEMAAFIDSVTLLRIEMYEVKRFLTGLFTWPPPQLLITEVLGTHLASLIGFHELPERDPMTMHAEQIIDTQVQHINKYPDMVTAIRERLVSNLLID